MTNHNNVNVNSNAPSTCNYTDGPQYVGCQVAAKGWPTPQYMGGRKKKSLSKRKSTTKRAKKAGSLLSKAIVPFGLFVAQKRTQRRHGHHHGKPHKKRSSKKRSTKKRSTKRRR